MSHWTYFVKFLKVADGATSPGSSFCLLRPCVSCLTAKDNTCLCFLTLYCLSFRSGSDSSPDRRRWSGGPRTDDQIRFGSKDGNLVCACLSASSSSPKTPVLPICVTTCLRTPTLSGSHLHFSDHKWATLPPPRPSGSSLGSPSSRLCFPWMSSVCILPHFIPLLFPPLLHLHPVPSTISLFSQSALLFPLSPNLLCTLTQVLKDGSAHICAAKSRCPAGTYCSCRRCQPAPISFMNHFLSTFFFLPRVASLPHCWCSVFSPGDIRNSRYFWHCRRPAWPLVLRRRAQMTP